MLFCRLLLKRKNKAATRAPPKETRAALEPALGPEAAVAALELASGYASQVMWDRKTLDPIAQRAQQAHWSFCVLPELPEDIHDLEGLDGIGARLVSTR